MLESAAEDSSDCPTRDARPDVHWFLPKLQQDGTGKRPLLGLSQPGARPNVPAVRQAIQVRQHGQGGKGAKAREGEANSDRVVIFRILAQLVLATGDFSSRDIKVGGPCSLH